MIQYFTPAEFACGCGCELGYDDMNDGFLTRLDDARHFAGVPFVIASSIRYDEYNARVGGVADSAHCKGMAVDIEATNSRTRHRIITGLLQAGFNRIGIGLTYVHVDADQTKPSGVMWVYPQR